MSQIKREQLLCRTLSLWSWSTERAALSCTTQADKAKRISVPCFQPAQSNTRWCVPNANADDGDQQLSFAVQSFFPKYSVRRTTPKRWKEAPVAGIAGFICCYKGQWTHRETQQKEVWFGLTATSSFLLLSVLCKCYFQFHSYGEKHGVFLFLI